MNYANIKNNDIANGEGIRVSLFVSGCNRHCLNCFNKETWDFNYGKPFDTSVEEKIIKMLEPDYITGLTLLGGEPMEASNQEALLPFLKKVRDKFGNNKTIWCYTGFTYEELTGDSNANCEYTKELLSLIDVLVDGPYIESLRDISLQFKGSSNQRIINLKQTLKENKIVIYLP